MLSEEYIREKIKKFLEAADIPAEIKISSANENTFSAALFTEEEAGYLIGKGGENLDAIEHLIRLVVNKGTEQPARLFVDLNDYKERRAVVLRERARAAADKVKAAKTMEILEPMNSFERRIIHFELAGRGDVMTESVGEEPYRQVVIKPAL